MELAAVALNLFSPAFTLIVYAVQAQLRGAKSIDVKIAFTSIAIIDIIASPANSLLGVMAEAAAVLAAFDRIQTYLLSPDREDKREFLDKRYSNGTSSSPVTLAADGSTVHACVDAATLRPVRVPAWLSDALVEFETPG